jgi:MoxR-like ATPase
VSYPGLEEERAIVHHGGGSASHDIRQYGITAQADRSDAGSTTVGPSPLSTTSSSYIAAGARTRKAPT